MLPRILNQLHSSLENQAETGAAMSHDAQVLREELSQVASALKLASDAGIVSPDHFAGIASGNLSDVGPLLTGTCGKCGGAF